MPIIIPAQTHQADSRPPRTFGLQQGFTLLELLVVVVIVSILFTYTTLAIRTDSPEDLIKQEAQRLERLIQLALEESILRGEEYAIEFHIDSYRFLRFENNRWQPLSGDKILRERQLAMDMEIEMSMEETEIVMKFGSEKSLESDENSDDEDKEAKPEPQIFILSSGEITPEFDVRFYILGIDTSYFVKAYFDGSVTTEMSEL
jgi:general secretion pathway protein H